MASYLFTWSHAASEVFVTGTFDDWGKTIQLDKKGDHFEKRVQLPDPNTPVHYKFVVDGNWVTDHTAPQANDGQNNLNNILRPEKMDRGDDATMAFRTGVGPQSTTAQLAGAVPKEDSKRLSHMPGEFPMTPTQDMPEFTSDTSAAPSEAQRGEATSEEKHTAPSATAGETTATQSHPQQEQGGARKTEAAPPKATDPSASQESAPKEEARDTEPRFGAQKEETHATEPRFSTSKEETRDTEPRFGAQKEETRDPEPRYSAPKEETRDPEPRFSVNPLPATAGAGNPIDLKPGDKVPNPSSFTPNTISSTVRLDRESYERSDSLPVLPPVVTPDVERSRKGTGVLDLPPIMKNLIPESSLPMGGDEPQEKDPGVHLSSVAPESSTVGLAAQVPREPRERSTPAETEKQGASAHVPSIVEESQHKAHVDPEASAVPEAVAEKQAVEEELEEKVPTIPPTTEGIAGETPAERSTDASKSPEMSSSAATEPADTPATAVAGGPTPVNGTSSKTTDRDADITGGAQSIVPDSKAIGDEKQAGAPEWSEGAASGSFAAGGLPPSVMRSIQQMNIAADERATTDQHTASGVPDVVAESRSKAHWEPEAAANEEAVVEKQEVERELLQEVKRTESAGEPAPTASAALTETAPQPTTGDRTATTTIPSGTFFSAVDTPKTEFAPAAEPQPAMPTSTRSAMEPRTTDSTPMAEPQQAMPISTPTDDGLAAPATSPAMVPITKKAVASPPPVPVKTATPVSTYTPPVTQGTPAAPLVTTGVDKTTTESMSTPPKAAAPSSSALAAAQAASSSPMTGQAAGTPQKPGAPTSGHATLSTPKTTTTSAASTPHTAGASSSVAAADSPSSTTSKKEKRKSGFFGKLKEKLRK